MLNVINWWWLSVKLSWQCSTGCGKILSPKLATNFQRKVRSFWRYPNFLKINHYYYYYYTCLMASFPVNRYQKGKISLDLNEARDDGVLGCSGISWTICKQSAPHSRQIATPAAHHKLLQAGCSSWHPTVLKHWRYKEQIQCRINWGTPQMSNMSLIHSTFEQNNGLWWTDKQTLAHS